MLRAGKTACRHPCRSAPDVGLGVSGKRLILDAKLLLPKLVLPALAFLSPCLCLEHLLAETSGWYGADTLTFIGYVT